ncbi:MAG: hypothetical protein KDI46_09120 [Alphaproteobacteria bacterium]|nr:hypothetical protein [Alphaproteobacteria bacterium]
MALCLFPGTSHAACIAGIPCVTGLTPNDPDAPTHPNTPPAPNAAKSGSPACDADFMNQIYANAYTEAERNITYSEVLIRKPDSVLEYSCFDQGAAVVANSVAPLFGESTFWAPSVWPNPNAGNIVINVSLGAAHADNWINALVLDSLKKNYIDQNFAHTYYGGAAAVLDSEFSANVAGVGAACADIYNVHFLSKCDSFAPDAPFMLFSDLAGMDPRIKPAACGAAHKITAALLELKENKDVTYVAYDKIIPYLDRMMTSDNNACDSDPIPTGLIVENVEYTEDINANPVIVGGSDYKYKDKVCPNPACYFDNGGTANDADDSCKM